eukprot:TRINITY_DN39187_c0_g1_i1.p1 TRINITY_DN39187_c0_g1~~TRINITY_DN39187_c0_g1_i1.p1  ORF type:complete len:161 (-),score=26.33 TRINITY_DN39187_c0_g1_i1:91-573(-)
MITAAAALQELSRLIFKSSPCLPSCDTWKIVDGSQEDGWMSWESLGLKVQNPLHNVFWKRCTDMEFAWSGLMRIEPGHKLVLHKHAPAEVYYILKGTPTVTLADTEHLCHPHQCVSIPSFCPHGVSNTGEEEVIICYTYLPSSNTLRPGPQHQWAFLEVV